MPFNSRVMPTNDANYSCHIKAVELVLPNIWGPYHTVNYYSCIHVIIMTMATALLSHYLVLVALQSQVIVLYDVNQLLLLCGNVHLNPGHHMRQPCAMCYCPVHWNQKAVLGDACGLRSHCKCCNVSDLEYSRYQVLDNFLWHCPSFTVETLSFHDCSILTSSDAN